MRMAPRGSAVKPRWPLSLLGWLPLLGALVYAAVLLSSFREILRQATWDSDVAAPLVIAGDFGTLPQGSVVYLTEISHFVSLGFDILVAGLPWHRQLWLMAPYVMFLGGLAVLVAVAAALAGRWAALITAALSLSVAPAVLQDLVRDFHVSTLGGTIVAGAFVAYLQVAAGRPRRERRAIAVAVTAILGLGLASDPLLAVTGIVPLLLTAIGLTRRPRSASAPRSAKPAVTVALAALALALATHVGARALGFLLAIYGFPPVLSIDRLVQNAGLLANGLVEVFDGPSLALAAPLAWVPLVLAVVAVLLTFYAAGVGGDRSGDRSLAAASDAYFLFWGLSLTLLLEAFLFSGLPVDAGAVRYLPTAYFAVVAVVPIWVARHELGRAIGGLAAGGLCVLAALAVARATSDGQFHPAHARSAEALIASLEARNLSVGYGDYFDAAVVTWKTGGRVRISAIVVSATGVQPYRWYSISSWYTPVPGRRTFVVVDPREQVVRARPSGLGEPVETYSVDDLEVMVFPYDVASRFSNR